MTSAAWALIVVVVLFLAMAGVNVVGYLAARDGRPRRNQILGIRTAQTLRSGAAWRASQVVGWRRRLVLVPLYLAAVVVLLVLPGQHADSRLLPVVVVMAVADLAVSLSAVSRANRAARSIPAA
jgi:hypothetical protein